MAARDYLDRIDAGLAQLGIVPALIAARGLEACEEAAELVSIGFNTQNREQFLAPPAAHAWQRMRAAALTDGIELLPVSAFRSFDRQVEIIRRKLDAGQSCEQILGVSAPPGYSEHHGGCALDVGTPQSESLEESFGDSAAFAWLQRHAGSFGFRLSYPRGNAQGCAYEPWHWCWHPPGA